MLILGRDGFHRGKQNCNTAVSAASIVPPKKTEPTTGEALSWINKFAESACTYQRRRRTRHERTYSLGSPQRKRKTIFPFSAFAASYSGLINGDIIEIGCPQVDGIIRKGRHHAVHRTP